MTTYVLTVRSKSGKKINLTKTQDHESIGVYSKADLDERLNLIAQDSDLQATWREAPSLEEAWRQASS